jgi:folate-binding protein YgfZ
MEQTRVNPIVTDSERSRSAPEAGWRIRSTSLVVRVTGEDRVTFFHGICSNDIKGMAPGGIVYALILTDHAHIISDVHVWAQADALWLEIDRELWPATQAHLEKFLVADDVEFQERPEDAVMELLGDPAWLARAGWLSEAAPAPNQFTLRDGLMIGNSQRYGHDACCVIGPRDRLEALGTRLQPSGVALTEAECERLRIEAGWARVGQDTNERTLAMEAGLERAISFNKGCYLGQETVERATSRGGVKRRLMGLRIEAAACAPGHSIEVAGRAVGQLTSVALSPRHGLIGLGIVQQAVWAPGTEVTIVSPDGGLAARISELPFQ